MISTYRSCAAEGRRRRQGLSQPALALDALPGLHEGDALGQRDEGCLTRLTVVCQGGQALGEQRRVGGPSCGEAGEERVAERVDRRTPVVRGEHARRVGQQPDRLGRGPSRAGRPAERRQRAAVGQGAGIRCLERAPAELAGLLEPARPERLLRRAREPARTRLRVGAEVCGPREQAGSRHGGEACGGGLQLARDLLVRPDRRLGAVQRATLADGKRLGDGAVHPAAEACRPRATRPHCERGGGGTRRVRARGRRALPPLRARAPAVRSRARRRPRRAHGARPSRRAPRRPGLSASPPGARARWQRTPPRARIPRGARAAAARRRPAATRVRRAGSSSSASGLPLRRLEHPVADAGVELDGSTVEHRSARRPVRARRGRRLPHDPVEPSAARPAGRPRRARPRLRRDGGRRTRARRASARRPTGRRRRRPAAGVRSAAAASRPSVAAPTTNRVACLLAGVERGVERGLLQAGKRRREPAQRAQEGQQTRVGELLLGRRPRDARMTSKPSVSASRSAASRSAVFPIPGSPTNAIDRARPPRASSRAAVTRSSSC